MTFRTILIFLVISLGGGLLIGSLSSPDEWYRALAKPAFNPPSWVFAPVWSILYVLIGIAGARAWTEGHRVPIRFWFAQMVLNFLWTPTFFVAHRPDFALVVILALLLAIIGFIVTIWEHDRLSVVLFLPYLAWVGFATILNGSILALN